MILIVLCMFVIFFLVGMCVMVILLGELVDV